MMCVQDASEQILSAGGVISFLHGMTRRLEMSFRQKPLGSQKLVTHTVFQTVEGKNQWPFQEPKLEVPTIYKAYVRPM
jgi:hypothetical protein